MIAFCPAFLAALLALAPAARRTQEAATRPPIALPAAPSATVIVIGDISDWSQTLIPLLTVSAEGRFVASQDDQGKVSAGAIPAAEFQELLHFIVDEQQFFMFDPHDEEQEIKRLRSAGSHYDGSDGSTTVILITTAERTKETRFYNLREFATLNPTSALAARLAAIDVHLRKLTARLKTGDRKEATGRDIP